MQLDVKQGRDSRFGGYERLWDSEGWVGRCRELWGCVEMCRTLKIDVAMKRMLGWTIVVS